MDTIYACRKTSGQLVLAFDFLALDDPKITGALLKLAGEAGMTIDRVARYAVAFEDPKLFRQDPPSPPKAGEQLGMNFREPAPEEAPAKGPAEMGEGFTCGLSGSCEKRTCEGCEHANEAPPALDPVEQEKLNAAAAKLAADVAAQQFLEKALACQAEHPEMCIMTCVCGAVWADEGQTSCPECAAPSIGPVAWPEANTVEIQTLADLPAEVQEGIDALNALANEMRQSPFCQAVLDAPEDAVTAVVEGAPETSDEQAQ